MLFHALKTAMAPVFSLLGCILVGFGLNSPALAKQPLFIEVISSDAYPLTAVQSVQQQGYSIKTYNLDQGDRLIAQIGAHLPQQQDRAKKVMLQRFKKMGDAKVKKLFIQAYQVVMLSTQYGLTRYPAVVFDHGHAVIYGVTDLALAVRLYQQWKQP